MIKCKICESTIDSTNQFIVKENMLGTGKEFLYNHCSNCDSLQINEAPENLNQYYVSSYYTYNKNFDISRDPSSLFYHTKRILSRTFLFHILRLVHNLQILNFIHYGQLKTNSKILDVGCGNGDLLCDFHKYGFRNLYGIDPLFKNEFRSQNLNLYQADIFQTTGSYDFIIFNHSFEHIEDPLGSIKRARDLLTKKGSILIRTPIVNYAFEKYKENWVQLDAPRHLIIHSEKSIKILCKMAGLIIYKIIYDSDEFQFMGSEQYVRNIALNSPNSYLQNISKSIFSNSDLKRYKHLSRKLNKRRLGDQASIYMKIK